MKPWVRQLGLTAGVLLLLTAWRLTSGAQVNSSAGKLTPQPAKPGTQFVFEVVESFDAKYLGDTPGHAGRSGGLDNVRPNVALGDPVHRGTDIIGTVSSVVWSRPQGSLTIEFDPIPQLRISVGDQAWVDLNPAAASKNSE